MFVFMDFMNRFGAVVGETEAVCQQVVLLAGTGYPFLCPFKSVLQVCKCFQVLLRKSSST